MNRTIGHAQCNGLRIYRPECPNDSNRNDTFQKRVDIVTSIVSAAGFVCAMVFLATMP